jgi:hypothetical protein
VSDTPILDSLAPEDAERALLVLVHIWRGEELADLSRAQRVLAATVTATADAL